MESSNSKSLYFESLMKSIRTFSSSEMEIVRKMTVLNFASNFESTTISFSWQESAEASFSQLTLFTFLILPLSHLLRY